MLRGSRWPTQKSVSTACRCSPHVVFFCDVTGRRRWPPSVPTGSRSLASHPTIIVFPPISPSRSRHSITSSLKPSQFRQDIAKPAFHGEPINLAMREEEWVQKGWYSKSSVLCDQIFEGISKSRVHSGNTRFSVAKACATFGRVSGSKLGPHEERSHIMTSIRVAMGQEQSLLGMLLR